MFNKLICWFFGHNPDDAVSGTVTVMDIDFNVTVCKCCDATLVYDEQLMGWVAW